MVSPEIACARARSFCGVHVRLSACTSPVEPALLLERAFVSVASEAHMAIFDPVGKRGSRNL
jgi:hypothetical protein